MFHFRAGTSRSNPPDGSNRRIVEAWSPAGRSFSSAGTSGAAPGRRYGSVELAGDVGPDPGRNAMRIHLDAKRRLVVEDLPIASMTFAGVAAGALAFVLTGALSAVPVKWDVLAAAFVALLILVGLVLIVSKRSTFIFDFETNRLVWRRAGLLKRREETIPVEQIRSVAVQSTHGSGSDRTYRVVLTTATGTVPLTESFTADGKLCEKIAAAIREHLPGAPASPGTSRVTISVDARQI
jgi:membrane protein YdbS with pleckstrin-like domain